MALSAPVRSQKPRSRGWIVFFSLLVSLAGVAVTLPILYNLWQQLRPEQLVAARQRWQAVGPADYDLTYMVKYDGERPERHIVLVRQGRVAWASCEGEVVQVAPGVGAVVGLTAGGSLRGGRDVPAMFARIQELLDEQDGSARRNFLVVLFDPTTGVPRKVVRRVRGTGTREEWNLRVWGAGELERKAIR